MAYLTLVRWSEWSVQADSCDLYDLLDEHLLLTDYARNKPHVHRARIIDLFKENVFGDLPVEMPLVSAKKIEIDFGLLDGVDSSERWQLEWAGEKDNWAIVDIVFPYFEDRAPPVIMMLFEVGDQERELEGWLIQQALGHGFALATVYLPDYQNVLDSVAPYWQQSFKARALIGVRKFLARHESIDASRIAVGGHGLAGEASLWAAANDPNFWLSWNIDYDLNQTPEVGHSELIEVLLPRRVFLAAAQGAQESTYLHNWMQTQKTKSVWDYFDLDDQFMLHNEKYELLLDDRVALILPHEHAYHSTLAFMQLLDFASKSITLDRGMRVVSFNLGSLRGFPKDTPTMQEKIERATRIGQILNHSGSDLIGFQEFPIVKAVQNALLEGLGADWNLVTLPIIGGIRDRTSALAWKESSVSEIKSLAPPKGFFPREWGRASVVINQNQWIVHVGKLPPGVDRNSREDWCQELRGLKKVVKEDMLTSKEKLIVLADLNVTSDSFLYSLIDTLNLFDSMEKTASVIAPTKLDHVDRVASRKIDYVLAPRSQRVSILWGQVGLERMLYYRDASSTAPQSDISDHFPVLVDIGLGKNLGE